MLSMDWENIREFLGTVQGAYYAGAAGAVVALGMGYLTGRSSSKAKATRQNYELEKERLVLEGSKIELEREKLGVERLRTEGDPVELKKLEYNNQARIEADSRNRTELEARIASEEAERGRRIELEDSDRSRKFQSEDLTRKEGYELAKREHTLTIAREISGALGTVVQTYADAIKLYHSRNGSHAEDPNTKARAEYRAGVVDAILEKIKEEYGEDQEEYDINEDDQERVNRIVDARYPVPETSREPQMPVELKRLLDLLA